MISVNQLYDNMNPTYHPEHDKNFRLSFLTAFYVAEETEAVRSHDSCSICTKQCQLTLVIDVFEASDHCSCFQK